MEGIESNILVWAKPEDEGMVAHYTISVGRRTLCVDMPIDQALDSLRKYLEELAEDAANA